MKKYNRIFIGVFLLFLFVPILFLNHARELQLPDNRMAGEFPKINDMFGWGGGTACQSCAQFDAWFGDRFGLRNYILKIAFAIPNKPAVAGNSGIKVMQGADDWLFFSESWAIKSFRNSDLFSDDDLKIFAGGLTQFDDWCRKHGIKFAFVIAPDKSRIYGEYYPSGIKKARPDSESRANQTVRYMNENTRVKFAYLADDLMSRKNDGLLFFVNDTHWSWLGSYIASNAVLGLFGRPPLKAASFQGKKYPRGDLTAMNPALSDNNFREYDVPVYGAKVASVDSEFLNYKNPFIEKGKKKLTEEQKFLVYENKSGTGTLALLGDSFRQGLRENLSHDFGRTVVFPTGKMFGDEEKKAILKSGATHVLMVIVERSLPSVPVNIKTKD